MRIESCCFKPLSPDRIEEDSSGRSEESRWELSLSLWRQFLRSFGIIMDSNPDTYLEEREIPISHKELPVETREISQESEA